MYPGMIIYVFGNTCTQADGTAFMHGANRRTRSNYLKHDCCTQCLTRELDYRHWKWCSDCLVMYMSTYITTLILCNAVVIIGLAHFHHHHRHRGKLT